MIEKATLHRFRVLDSWRGICALLVALFHFQIDDHLSRIVLVRNAWLLVDFFFVLSGFVIAYAYAQRLGTALQIKTFVLRRFLRLWPLHVAILAAFVAMESYRFAITGTGFTGERSMYALFTNLLLIQSLGLHDTLTWNTPAWSISTEFYAYIVFACVCAASATARTRIVLSILLLAGGVALLLIFSPTNMRETFGLGFFRCLYGFFLGSLAYEIWARGWTEKLRGSMTEVAVVCAAAIFLIYVPGNPILEYFAPPIFAVVVLVFAQESGIVSRLMSTRGFHALGRWSYSIYMVHMAVIALLFSALDSAGGVTSKLADGSETVFLGNTFVADLLSLAYLAAVITIAAFTWRFVEVPGQRFLRETRSSKMRIAADAAAR